MQIGSSYDITSAYTIKLNEKEMLVIEEDETRKKEKTPNDTLKEAEAKKQKEKSKKTGELDPEEQQMVQKLQARDSEVRAHEAAHQSAGASTGGASYSYQQGPDGKMYAIGGEVSVQFKSGSTPQETIQNAQAVIAAAMAPASPSPQDYAVASSARVMMMKAQQQLAREQQDQMMGKESYKNSGLSNDPKEKQTPQITEPDTSGFNITG